MKILEMERNNIRDEQVQLLALSSNKIGKYEYLTSKE